MDAVRREQVDAILGNNPNCQEPTATVADDALPSIDTLPVVDLIESIALEAVAIPPNLVNAEGFHHSGSGDSPDATTLSDLMPEKQIGAYHISAWIGSGHVGNVYRATYADDCPRQVVVKFMQRTANKDIILKRFQNEIPIQAALAKHPNIATLLEAGTTEDGRLYFTMDYIEGQRIDEYCDNRRLDVPTRLRLFTHVCAAIHFAHQHAMIHRNLKPSNILVTDDGVPIVIDLGIAKLIQPDTNSENTAIGTNTTLTGTGESVLTPEYTSPEQIKGEAITTASDIYALGIVLYRLLSGRWPYRVTSQSTSDILRAICEQLPEKPSAAISRPLVDGPETPGDSPEPFSPAPEELAMTRGVSPRRLRKILRGDLDSIVLMALQKEPERRYASVEHLGEDLNSYLRGMPVRSRRRFPAYRPSKFIQRHVIAVAAGLLLLLLFLAGVIALTRGLLMARYERNHTERSFHQARQVLEQISTRITDERLLDQPAMHPLRSALLMDARHFYEDFLNQRVFDPQLGAERAMAQARIAKIASLTESGVKAISHYRQAITLWDEIIAKEPDNLEYQANLAQTLNDLGVMLLPLEGRLDEALNTFHQARKIVERLISTQPKSVSLYLQLGLTLLNIAEVNERQGKLNEAITSVEQALRIESQVVAEYSELLEPHIALATGYAALGRLLAQKPEELLTAIAHYQQAIEFREAVTRQHPQLVDQSYQLALELSKLGGLQQELGQPELALQCLRRARDIFEHIAEPYPDIALYQEGLGTTYNTISDLERKQGGKTEALDFAQKARKLFEHLVAENPKNVSYRRDLAKSYNCLGRLQAQTADSAIALRSFQRAVDVFESLHELSAKDSYNLACNIALCISLITRKAASQSTPQEPSKADRLRCQLYGDRAIELLRRAFNGGFLNSQVLQDETDLDSLRSRADFQALLKTIEEMPTTSVK